MNIIDFNVDSQYYNINNQWLRGLNLKQDIFSLYFSKHIPGYQFLLKIVYKLDIFMTGVQDISITDVSWQQTVSDQKKKKTDV